MATVVIMIHVESIELHSGLKDTGGVSRLCDIGNTDVCGKSHIDL